MDGEGLSFSIIDGDRRDRMLPKLRGISNEWLKTVHGTEKGFSLGFFEEDYLKNFPVAVAVKEGEPLAFCNLWLGGGDEFSVDLMTVSYTHLDVYKRQLITPSGLRAGIRRTLPILGSRSSLNPRDETRLFFR